MICVQYLSVGYSPKWQLTHACAPHTRAHPALVWVCGSRCITDCDFYLLLLKPAASFPPNPTVVVCCVSEESVSEAVWKSLPDRPRILRLRRQVPPGSLKAKDGAGLVLRAPQHHPDHSWRHPAACLPVWNPGDPWEPEIPVASLQGCS